MTKESDVNLMPSEAISRRFAAIDMGSNSFQLQLLELSSVSAPKGFSDQQQWRKLLYKKDRVQLSAGLDNYNRLTEPAMQKALNVLNVFLQALEPYNPVTLRIVGTKALRQAINSDDFVQRIFQTLGRTAEIIDGVEEARLIYSGVANTRLEKQARLVIDVGGGSTEFIVGEGFEPLSLDSTSLGCVTTQLKFFEKGVITEKQLKLAETQASLKLLRLRNKLKSLQWEQVIGCSGVFEALFEVQQWLINKQAKATQPEVPNSPSILTLDGLEMIRQQILTFENSADIDFASLGESRKKILPAALTIVLAIFKTLNFSQLELSDAALKDGVIFELHNDHEINKTRQQTLRQLMKQYQVDGKQALRILASVTEIWMQLSQHWKLENPRNLLVLNWAALLHEIGQSISPHNFAAHGAYLIANTELSGFNKSQQQLLSVLIAGQSGNIPTEILHSLSEGNKADSWYLLIALRLAKILRSNREQKPPAKLKIVAEDTRLNISVRGSNDPDSELLWAALIDECEYQKQVGFEITLQGNLNLET